MSSQSLFLSHVLVSFKVKFQRSHLSHISNVFYYKISEDISILFKIYFFINNRLENFIKKCRSNFLGQFWLMLQKNLSCNMIFHLYVLQTYLFIFFFFSEKFIKIYKCSFHYLLWIALIFLALNWSRCSII